MVGRSAPSKKGDTGMIAIPMEQGLAVAAVLFVLGLIGVMVRRNILFVLMCIEVMMNAAAWHLSLRVVVGGNLTVK